VNILINIKKLFVCSGPIGVSAHVSARLNHADTIDEHVQPAGTYLLSGIRTHFTDLIDELRDKLIILLFLIYSFVIKIEVFPRKIFICLVLDLVVCVKIRQSSSYRPSHSYIYKHILRCVHSEKIASE